MKSFTSLFLAGLLCFPHSFAQDETITYTDRASGIVFNTWTSSSSMTLGMALPSNALSTDATEFIGLVTCASPNGQGTGWCGVSLGGGMNENLLLLVYPQAGKVLTSFRWATNYRLPVPYTGDARLTQVSSTVNSTHYSVIFRCHNCLEWQQDGAGEPGTAPTSEGYLILGWCHATASPANGACPSSLSVRQHDEQGILAARFNSHVANPSYSAWAARATSIVAGDCGRPSAVPTGIVTSVTTLRPPSTPTPTPGSCARTYTVKAGDYCYLIATNNGLSLDQFYGINPGLNCNPLQIGVVVCVRRN